jgi:hypothetical protein
VRRFARAVREDLNTMEAEDFIARWRARAADSSD